MSTETKTTDEPLRGEKLLKAAINQILAHPESWDQSVYHSSCGTRHCIAGLCQILSGAEANRNTAADDAAWALGLTAKKAEWLFDASRTLGEIYDFAQRFWGASYDRAGVNISDLKLQPFEL